MKVIRQTPDHENETVSEEVVATGKTYEWAYIVARALAKEGGVFYVEVGAVKTKHRP
jgi:hypothetical protein